MKFEETPPTISKLVGSKLASSKGASGSKSVSSSVDKQKKVKSIQDDPNATKTYKSLFTTCEKARNQPKPHWVTNDPCFY